VVAVAVVVAVTVATVVATVTVALHCAASPKWSTVSPAAMTTMPTFWIPTRTPSTIPTKATRASPPASLFTSHQSTIISSTGLFCGPDSFWAFCWLVTKCGWRIDGSSPRSEGTIWSNSNRARATSWCLRGKGGYPVPTGREVG
jgi:hypothetical protein